MTSTRAAALLLSLMACATAQLKGPPPQRDAGPACGANPVIMCDAGAPGEGGCAGEPYLSSESVTRPSYPVGCRAYFSGPDCSTESSCSCTRDDAGAPLWVCNPT